MPLLCARSILENQSYLLKKIKLGGAGIHQGALWSKTWWEISREARMINLHSEAFNLGSNGFVYSKVRDEVMSAVDSRFNLLTDHMDRMNKSSESELFQFRKGKGKVVGKNEVEIVGDAGSETVEAEYIILATGSVPRKLAHLPIDEETVFTSDGLDNLTSFPKSIVIVGAGVIGCEFATIFFKFWKDESASHR